MDSSSGDEAREVTLTSKHNLASLYRAQGQYAKAEPLAREVAESWKKRAGADSVAFARQLAFLGLVLLQQQKASDAEPVLRACLAIREKRAPGAWTTFAARSQLGGSLLGQKKYAEAEPLLFAGYEGMKARANSIPRQGQVSLTEAVERLVQLYDAWGKKDQADKWRQQRPEAAKARPAEKAK